MHAVIRAASTRLRQILMTTVATVVGHMPLVFATGPGAAEEQHGRHARVRDDHRFGVHAVRGAVDLRAGRAHFARLPCRARSRKPRSRSRNWLGRRSSHAAGGADATGCFAPGTYRSFSFAVRRGPAPAARRPIPLAGGRRSIAPACRQGWNDRSWRSAGDVDHRWPGQPGFAASEPHVARQRWNRGAWK